MTINSTIRKAGPFIGNGTASSFPFTYKVFQASDLEVVLLDQSTNVETTLVLTTQYTVTLNQDQDSNPGGTVTLVAGPLAAGYTLTMTSDVPNLQPTDLTNQGGFYPEVINDSLDRATIQIQQLQEQGDRTLRLPLSSTADGELPPPSANELIGWNSTGTGLTNVDPGSLATVVAYATAYCDVFVGDGVTTSWTLTRNPAVLFNLDVSINGSTQEPTRDYTLTGTTFTMTTPPPLNSRVVVKYKEGLPNYEGDSQDVRFVPAGAGAVIRSAQSKLRDVVSVKDFGAVGDGVTDDTAAIQAAATACSASGSILLIPAVSTFYLISDTIDFSEVKSIDGTGAELRGTFSGKPAAIIGGASTTFRGADIYLKVRNTTDESTTSGTHGIKLLSFRNSRLTLFARGFLNGLYFDGNSGTNRAWVDNRIDVLELYNNKNQVHFDMGGGSYAVKNQFVGGSYFVGAITPTADSGTFKLSLAGTSLVSDILVQSPEIGITRSGIDVATHGVFVYADAGNSFDINTIDFVDTRFEGYSWDTSNPYAVNIATNASGRLGVSVEFSGSMSAETAYTRFSVFQPTSKQNRIRLSSRAIRPQGNSVAYPQTIIPDEVVPYQTVNRCYVPGRVIYDQATGYNVPVDFFSSAFGSNTINRANGDGDMVASSTTDSYGLIYTKTVGEVLFLELHKLQQVAVVCFDASGNILSGTAPWYAQGENLRSVTRGAVTIYEFSGRWLWLHKDVASFYIGAARWSSAGKLEDIRFDVLYGRPIDKLNNMRMSPRNNVANVSPAQTFMPLGAEMTGTASNGWRNTFYLRTTTSAGASSGATAIDLTIVTGITGGDTIGIELDTEIATGLRRYQYTTVSSVVGSTVNLGAALAANVASGRTVLLNRWVVK